MCLSERAIHTLSSTTSARRTTADKHGTKILLTCANTRRHIRRGPATTQRINRDKHALSQDYVLHKQTQSSSLFQVKNRRKPHNTEAHTFLRGPDRVSLTVYICKLHVWDDCKTHTHTRRSRAARPPCALDYRAELCCVSL